jgi:hypothetical protein
MESGETMCELALATRPFREMRRAVRRSNSIQLQLSQGPSECGPNRRGPEYRKLLDLKCVSHAWVTCVGLLRP